MRVLAVTLIVLLSGCSLFENEQSIPGEWTGQWQWVRSSGGFVGRVIDADSVDYTQSLKVFQDNRAVWYKDGEMMMRYRLDPKTEDGKRRFVMHPQLKDKAKLEFTLTLLGIQNGMLRVMDDCADCYIHSFVKK